jgi:hypothetical protein
MNKRMKYMRVYGTLKRIGQQQNALTKLFVRVFMKIFKVKESEVGA